MPGRGSGMKKTRVWCSPISDLPRETRRSMPLRMFKLKPGEKMLYRVSVPGRVSDSPLSLEASRPQEGLSIELELRLVGADCEELAPGRVPLAAGYLAVIQEVERQLLRVVEAGQDGEVWFELLSDAQLERHS